MRVPGLLLLNAMAQKIPAGPAPTIITSYVGN
jgi:hypothetical protein